HFVVSVAVARATRSARQRDDSGKGADAGAAALRELRVLRQAHARATRSVEPPSFAGDAHLRVGAERDLVDQLRHAADQLLAVGSRAAGARGSARVPRRSEILRRQIPSVPVALAGNAHAAVSGDGAGTRRSR